MYPFDFSPTRDSQLYGAPSGGPQRLSSRFSIAPGIGARPLLTSFSEEGWRQALLDASTRGGKKSTSDAADSNRINEEEAFHPPPLTHAPPPTRFYQAATEDADGSLQGHMMNFSMSGADGFLDEEEASALYNGIPSEDPRNETGSARLDAAFDGGDSLVQEDEGQLMSSYVFVPPEEMSGALSGSFQSPLSAPHGGATPPAAGSHEPDDAQRISNVSFSDLRSSGFLPPEEMAGLRGWASGMTSDYGLWSTSDEQMKAAQLYSAPYSGTGSSLIFVPPEEMMYGSQNFFDSRDDDFSGMDESSGVFHSVVEAEEMQEENDDQLAFTRSDRIADQLDKALGLAIKLGEAAGRGLGQTQESVGGSAESPSPVFPDTSVAPGQRGSVESDGSLVFVPPEELMYAQLKAGGPQLDFLEAIVPAKSPPTSPTQYWERPSGFRWTDFFMRGAHGNVVVPNRVSNVGFGRLLASTSRPSPGASFSIGGPPALDHRQSFGWTDFFSGHDRTTGFGGGGVNFLSPVDVESDKQQTGAPPVASHFGAEGPAKSGFARRPTELRPPTVWLDAGAPVADNAPEAFWTRNTAFRFTNYFAGTEVAREPPTPAALIVEAPLTRRPSIGLSHAGTKAEQEIAVASCRRSMLSDEALEFSEQHDHKLAVRHYKRQSSNSAGDPLYERQQAMQQAFARTSSTTGIGGMITVEHHEHSHHQQHNDNHKNGPGRPSALKNDKASAPAPDQRLSRLPTVREIYFDVDVDSGRRDVYRGPVDAWGNPSGPGGELWMSDGSVYVGDFEDGRPQGSGLFESRAVRYEGEFRQGRFCGQGTILYKDEQGGRVVSSYVGRFLDDKEHGDGTFYFANGDSYMGFFKNGAPVGEGIYSHGPGAAI